MPDQTDDRERVYYWFKSTGSVHYNCWESHMRTKEECAELLESTVKRFDQSGPKYPGLTYEEGMIDTLIWMLGRETEMDQPEWADE